MEKKYLTKLVGRLFDKQIDADELGQLNEWYDSLDTEEHSSPENRKSKSWSKLHGIIGSESKQVKRFTILSWIGKVAAVALLIIGAYAVVHQKAFEIPQVISESGSFSNDIGVVSLFLLPDSTQVWLSSGSTVEFVADFQNNRQVSLQGEAFFQVKSDTLHPFEIQIGEVYTEVLGTSFNLKGYKEESVELEVYTGKVLFGHQDQKDAGHSLVKNQKIKWDHEKGMESIQTFNSSQMPDWQQGIFRFEEAGINEIIQELERWYPLDFVVMNGGNKANCRYTGEFTQSSLEQVLEILSYTLNLTYQINENEVIIKLKPCK